MEPAAAFCLEIVANTCEREGPPWGSRTSSSRDEDVGCFDVGICADLVDPGRVNIFGALGVAGGAWRLSAAATLTRNGAWLCTRCTFQEYDIVDAGRVSGRVRNGSAGRTLLRPVRSAPRSRLIEQRQTQREGNRHHETDDHGAGLR